MNLIATGALLHDLGKLEIPPAILTKPGKLTDEEFAVIQQHPTTGLLALRNNPDMTFGQLMMVYQHHERLDGKGYPAGVGENEIHEWARLCTVTDVFEALTSNRPYRSKMSFAKAFDIMDRPDENRFDQEILSCWKAIILRN